MQKTKLESFRRDLVARREILARDLRQATTDFINDDVTHADSVDQAAADTDRTLAMQMKNRERDTLWQIDEAIKRIESGAYGDCESCGESIMEARIKAFPFTTLCIDCKAALESEGHRFPRQA